jgi:hypothetical protein
MAYLFGATVIESVLVVSQLIQQAGTVGDSKPTEGGG